MLFVADDAGLDLGPIVPVGQPGGRRPGGGHRPRHLRPRGPGAVRFHDSISQPVIEGLRSRARRATPSGPASSSSATPTIRPVHRPAHPAGLGPRRNGAARDPAGSGGADLGRNGTYVVFRQLRQDVTGFWRYFESVTRNPDGSANAAAKVRLGARFVGRWPGGAPLVLSPGS